MNLDWVRGPIANVFTCFNADLSIDRDGQRRFLDYLLETSSVTAYFVRSGMGQMYSYEYRDVETMVQLATGHLRGVAPVLAGTTGIWDRNLDRRPGPRVFLKEALDLTRMAEDAGAAGTVHTLPEAIAPEPGQRHADVIFHYFEAINAAAEKPVFIYQPPPTLPEYRLTVDLAQRLAPLPRIAGAKLSTPDAGYLLDIIWATRNDIFTVICGNETAFYAGLAMGARAVIGQGCCVNPAILKAVQSRFDGRDHAGAMEAQRSVNLLCEQSPPAVAFLKRYVTEKGYSVQPYARPGGNPCLPDPPPLTDAGYTAYKALLESELARFA